MQAAALILLVTLALSPLAAFAQAQQPLVLPLSGDVAGTHDPSIARDGDAWYVFSTGKTAQGGEFAIRCSDDLKLWRLCGEVFDDIPVWVKQKSPGTKELWAPDVHYVRGQFRLYYSYSLFGKNTSGIGLAVNQTLNPQSPNYKWVDKGLVLESQATDHFNAIDPNFVQDAEGHGWLAFGSFWDGIKLRRLDDTTGLASTTDTRIYSLARRSHASETRPLTTGNSQAPAQAATQTATGLNETITSLPPDTEAIEAPFLVPFAGYYYLFTSWDLCCRGTHSTYRTVVGRSRSITGPYLDRSGKKLEDGGGTPLLTANARWLGPGGASVLTHKGVLSLHLGGKDLIVFHAYDAKTGKPSMQISTLAWNDGWPTAALATQ